MEEVGTLVVKLTGDASSYNAMMATAQATAQKTTGVMTTMTGSVTAFAGGITTLSKEMTKMLAAVGIAAGVWTSFAKVEEYERVIIRLTAAIRANGEAVQETLKSHLEFAKVLSRTTALSSGQSRSLVATAAAYGLTAEATQRATRMAVGLAGMVETLNPEQALRFAIAVEKGDQKMAVARARMIPALQGIRDEYKLLEEAQRLAQAGWEVEAEFLKTASGQLAKMKQIMGELTREIGKAIAVGIKPMVDVLVKLFNEYQKVYPEIRETTAAVIGLILAFTALVALKPILLGFWTSLTTVVAGFWAVLTNPAVMVFLAAVLSLSIATNALSIATGRQLTVQLRLNEAMRVQGELQEQWLSRRTGEQARFMTQTEGIRDEGARALALSARLQSLQSGLDTRRAQVRQAEEALEASGTTIYRWYARTVGGFFGRTPSGAAASQLGRAEEQQLAGAQRALEADQAAIRQIEMAMAGLRSTQRQLTDDIAETTEKLTDQAVQVGMTATEWQRFQFVMRGATTAQLAIFDLMAGLERGLKLGVAIKDLTRDLQIEAATFGMTAREARLYQLALQGIQDVQQSARYDSTTGWRGGIGGPLMDQMTAAAQMSRQLDLMDRARDVFDSTLTPLEKFNMLQADLQTLWQTGAITLETYTRAVENAKSQLQGMYQAQQQVAAGSAEDIVRIRRYTEALGFGRGGATPSGIQQSIFQAPAGIRDNRVMGPSATLVAPQLLSGARDESRDRQTMIDLLTIIKDSLKEIARRPVPGVGGGL